MSERQKKKTYVVQVRVVDDCEPSPLRLDDIAAAISISPRLAGITVLSVNVHNEDGKLLFAKKVKSA